MKRGLARLRLPSPGGLRRALIFVLIWYPVAIYGEGAVELRGDEIVYNGPLTPEANAKVFELYRSAKTPPVALVITSRGGPIDVGLELGEWVQSRGLDVKVPELCFSSCANYVFPAGRRKILGRTAIVGFHGGAFSAEYDRSGIDEVLATAPPQQRELLKAQIDRDLEQYLNENRKREAAFYAGLGVSSDLNILGEAEEYREYRTGDFNGWYYTPEDMNRLGLSNIVIDGGDWEPEAGIKEYGLFRVKLEK